MTAASKGNDPEQPAAPEAIPSGDYQELRALLIRPEREEIEALKQQLSHRPDVDARSVATVLPTAVTLAADKSDRLGQAMGPTIEKALTLSVRRNPEVITEAIFPIIGSAISRAVREALLRLMQQTSYALDHSFSLRGWKWRIEALATGKPFSEVVLLHSLVYRVEQVFLIHPESGLLLQHVIAESLAESLGADAQDAAMVTSMLTAIQDFVRDSFRMESKAALDSIEVGDLTVWIERGPHAVLAGVIRGAAPLSLRAVFRTALELCHRDALDILKSFSGDPDELKIIRPHLESCLQVHQRKEERSSLLTWLVLSALLICGGYWVTKRVLTERQQAARLRHAVTQLAAQEGIVVLDASVHNGRYALRILRDPDALTEPGLLTQMGLTQAETALTTMPYLAMEPRFVQRRAERALRPPSGVTLSYQPQAGVLTSNGMAQPEWIADAQRLATVIPGVQTYDCQTKPIPPARSLLDLLADKARKIEAIEFKFRAGSAELIPGQESQLASAVAEMKELLRLAEPDRSGLLITIEVIAYTDPIGTVDYNQKLRESRAKEMRLWLSNAGVDARHLKPVVIGPEQLTRVDRAASFHVVIRDPKAVQEDAK